MRNKKNIAFLLGILLLLVVLPIHSLWIHTPCRSPISEKTFHFSIDDVSLISSNLSNKKYNSIFEEPILQQLQLLHEKYGAVFSLYCMCDFCINSKYSHEITENRNWLRWGYHGLGASPEKKGIRKFNNQVRDSVGDDNCIDRCIRIDYYSANFLTCLKLLYCGYKGVYTADDWGQNAERNNNYYLNNNQCAVLNETNILRDFRSGLFFFKTDFRVENITKIWGSCKEMEEAVSAMDSDITHELVVFCHEINFLDNIERIDSILYFAQKSGYSFNFILR